MSTPTALTDEDIAAYEAARCMCGPHDCVCSCDDVAMLARALRAARADLAPMPCGHPRIMQHREQHATAEAYCTVCRLHEDADALRAERDALRAAMLKVDHHGHGRCPSVMYPQRRDPACPACRALGAP